MSSVLEVESDSEGQVAIPAKLLLETLKTFPEQPLTFVVESNNTIEISSNHGKYALAYASADEFPKTIALDNPSNTVVPSELLATAINKTIFAAGNDDLRPVMSGVFFELNSNSINFVATDAHKLVKYSRNDFSVKENTEFIMPKKPLQLLKNVLQDNEDDVKIEYNETNAQFTFKNSILISRLIDGKYPNYEAVIPKENPNELTIEKDVFLNSLKRVSIFSNKTTHQIKLKITGSILNISAEDFDYNNSAEETLNCDYKGDDIQIGFNSRFLIEMLNNLDQEEVKLFMSLPNRAGIIKPSKENLTSEEITMLVMPVMLND
jgi:DNA polymerase-3 subunit beta